MQDTSFPAVLSVVVDTEERVHSLHRALLSQDLNPVEVPVCPHISDYF